MAPQPSRPTTGALGEVLTSVVQPGRGGRSCATRYPGELLPDGCFRGVRIEDQSPEARGELANHPAALFEKRAVVTAKRLRSSGSVRQVGLAKDNEGLS